MATYQEIQKYVKRKSGFVPKNCWIAHMKELNGIPVKKAWNRKGKKRKVPCPPQKQKPIERAFRHFGMV